ncbi:GAF domain-containing protein [Bradyrhizobium manausense]|uniref:GAF domain-containing protein n=1 Tax=Bradyrhizobium manausense TaxID=989370 RepID=UPI001BAE3627|nr:GAF domain-containing protein [Bradyrhizobium manausense]MBR0836898.1 GAF domain-containing protein [Bradyrhizobium manausense]
MSSIESSFFARRSLLVSGLGAVVAMPICDPLQAATGSDFASDPKAHLAAIDDVARAGAEQGQPGILLARLDMALAQTIGHKLFTVLVLNEDVGQNQRYYSNQPGAYPVGGSKPIDRSSVFYKEIVLTGKPRICYDYEDTKRAFFDHELIRSLGCESAVNYPVRWNGKTIGTLNLLHQAGWYNEKNVAAIGAFAALSAPALLDIARGWK